MSGSGNTMHVCKRDTKNMHSEKSIPNDITNDKKKQSTPFSCHCSKSQNPKDAQQMRNAVIQVALDNTDMRV